MYFGRLIRKNLNCKHCSNFDVFILTAQNVNNRHTLVKGAIGVFPEEEYAYWLMNTLSWSLPLMIILGAIVDVILVYIYMRYTHPWRDILFYKDKKTMAEETETVNQSRETEEKEVEVAPEIIPSSMDLGDDLLESTDL